MFSTCTANIDASKIAKLIKTSDYDISFFCIRSRYLCKLVVIINMYSACNEKRVPAHPATIGDREIPASPPWRSPAGLPRFTKRGSGIILIVLYVQKYSIRIFSIVSCRRFTNKQMLILIGSIIKKET